MLYEEAETLLALIGPKAWRDMLPAGYRIDVVIAMVDGNQSDGIRKWCEIWNGDGSYERTGSGNLANFVRHYANRTEEILQIFDATAASKD